MFNQKYESILVYKAVQLLLHQIGKKLDSSPLLVFPGGMEMTPNGSMDPAFLPSWNKQVLRLLKDQPDTEGDINRMEEISMSVDEGYAVLIGFLGDYEKTLMSDESMLTLMASLKNEQDMPVQARPEGGYWEHWTRCLSTVVDSNQSRS